MRLSADVALVLALVCWFLALSWWPVSALVLELLDQLVQLAKNTPLRLPSRPPWR